MKNPEANFSHGILFATNLYEIDDNDKSGEQTKTIKGKHMKKTLRKAICTETEYKGFYCWWLKLLSKP